MATVWRARHEPTGEPAAIKVIVGERAQSETYRRAFRREVQAMARLEHPSIVRVYDYGTIAADAASAASSAGSPYLAMEYAQGGTLRQHASRISGWDELQPLLLSVLDALAYAHARDLVHRDLKPENILLGDGFKAIRLADFGIAYPLDPVRERIDADRDHLVSAGTPTYIAPEQATGDWRSFGPWTDLYALGCMCFELITGRPPFEDDNVVRLISKHVSAPVPELVARFACPSGVEQWLAGLLGKRPAERFQSAPQAAASLLELGAGGTVTFVPGTPVPDALADTVVVSETLPMLGTAIRTTEVDVAHQTEPLAVAALDATADTDNPTASEHLPRVPADWRRAELRAAPASFVSGLGLFGLREVPFVGRLQARDKLWATLREVTTTQTTHAAVLRGPAGAGKSRLAEWLTRRAREVDVATVLRARHNPDDAPGAGLARLLTNHFRIWGLSDAAALGRVRAEIDRLGPHLSEEQRDHDANSLLQLARPETDLARHSDRRALLGALRRWFTLSARHHPMIIWFDDAQWGTEALELTEQVLTTEQRNRVLVVLTIREDAIEGARARRLQRITDREQTLDLAIGPLGPDARRSLVQAMLPLDEALAHRVGRRTAGHPLFAVHLLGAWIEESLLERSADGYRLDDAQTALPADVAAICRQRLDNFIAAAEPERRQARRLALELAAVLGGEPRRESWAEACELAEAEVDLSELTAELIERGLARPSERDWRFAHGQFRQVLVDMARDAGRYEVHHDRCARALAAAQAATSVDRKYRYAVHVVEAQRYEDALAPLLDAYFASKYVNHWSEAERLLDMRKRCAAQLGYADDHPVCVRHALIDIQMATDKGQLEEARRLLDDVAGRIGPAQRTNQADYEHLLGCVEVYEGKLSSALAHLERAAELFDRPVDIGCTLAWTIDTQRMLGRLDDARETWRRALALLDPDAHRSTLTTVLSHIGYVCTQQDDFDAADAHLSQALALWEGRPGASGWDLSQLWNVRGEVERRRGNSTEALQHYQRARLLAQRVTAPVLMAVFDLNTGITLVDLERFDEATQTLLQAARTLTDHDDMATAAMARTVLGVCAAATSDWDLWHREVRPGLEWLETHDVVELENAQYGELAAALADAAGRHEQAALAHRVAKAQRAGLERA